MFFVILLVFSANAKNFNCKPRASIHSFNVTSKRLRYGWDVSSELHAHTATWPHQNIIHSMWYTLNCTHAFSHTQGEKQRKIHAPRYIRALELYMDNGTSHRTEQGFFFLLFHPPQRMQFNEVPNHEWCSTNSSTDLVRHIFSTVFLVVGGQVILISGDFRWINIDGAEC